MALGAGEDTEEVTYLEGIAVELPFELELKFELPFESGIGSALEVVGGVGWSKANLVSFIFRMLYSCICK